MIFTAHSSDPFTEQVATRVHQALDERLISDPDYSLEELSEITELDHRLFPSGFQLDFKTLERVRALAKLSRVELRPSNKITSHRKFIGPLIVWGKKAMWPFIQSQLKDSAAAQEEFNSLVVESFAKEIVKRDAI